MQLHSQQKGIKAKIKTIMTTSFNIIIDFGFGILSFIYNDKSDIILTLWSTNVCIYRPGLLLYPFLKCTVFFNALLSKS